MGEEHDDFREGSRKGPNPVAPDLTDAEHKEHHMIPVWVFVGALLLTYGVVILATGFYELSHPPSTVLANLHPAIWWGSLLVVIGSVYLYLFARRRS